MLVVPQMVGAADLQAGVALQEHAAVEEVHAEEHGFDILHHIQDTREIELPFGAVIHLPPAGSWMVGPVDLTPTKHVVFLWLTGAIVLTGFLLAAGAARRSHESGPKGGGHNAIEAAIRRNAGLVAEALMAEPGEEDA